MPGLREFFARLAGLLRGRRRDVVDEEIRGHLADLEASYLRRGMTRDEARRAARLAFGNVALVREEYHTQQSLPSVESVLHDLRYAARLLARHPGFTVTAVLTLALGIGLNTTLFTTLDAVMFRPLPVRDGSRLVRFERWFASQRQGNIQYFFAEEEYQYLSDHRAPLAELVAASLPITAEMDGSEPVHLQGVSANYFAALGMSPAAGRAFTPGDAGANLGVVVSYPFWQRQFARDPSLVGRAIRLNHASVTVVAIAPATFIGTGNPPEVPDVWAPIELLRTIAPRGNATRLQVLGYLPPGGTLAAASSAVALLAAPMGDAFPNQDATTALTLERASFFGETNDPRFHQFVAALMTAVGLVLLIACANLANMLFARATGRHKEIAMRLALGASRRRIVRQLLTESLLLALLGGAAGLAFSLWGARMLWLGLVETIQMFLFTRGALLISLSPDLRVFGYTLVVSVIAGFAFGLSPALRASGADLNTALKEEGTTAGHGVTRSWVRSLLVGTQVAVSMALLLVAGLLLRGFDAARRADPGYDAGRVFAVLFPRPDDQAAAAALEIRVAERLSRVPQLAAVSLADRIPMAGTWTPPVGVRRPSGRFVARTLANRADAEYFSVLDIPIVRGRNFVRDEHGDVAIISERGANLLWPGESPLGHTMTLDMDFRQHLRTFEVIGVARDVRTANLSRIDPSFVYLPVERKGSDNVLARINGDSTSALAAIRAALREIDPDLPARTSMLSVADGPMRFQRMTMTALTVVAATLALVALALAVAGIYGVVSYLSAARQFEIGVRVALGARPIDAVRLVMFDSLRPVAVGAVLGLAGAFALSALVRSSLSFPGTPDVLFGVSAFDATSFLGATALLAAVALAASAGPLIRSTRVDPVIALRQ
jgi:putative ABC transport system permease protein